MASFGSILEDIDVEIHDRHRYASADWVKILIKINRLAVSPYTFEEGSTIEEVGNSCYLKYRGKRFRDIMEQLVQFIKENEIVLRNI